MPLSTGCLARFALQSLALAALIGQPALGQGAPAAQPIAKPAQPAPLDLKIGDISRYVDPDILATPIPENLEEIIVRGQRPEPLPEQRVIPQGLGALQYSLQHPLQAWRILAPDPNFEIPLRTEDDVREPPGQYRGRILEPGRIFD